MQQGIENSFAQHVFSNAKEKTFVDKVTARDSIANVREIIKREHFNRIDLQDLLNLCSSEEIKLYNYNWRDRQVLTMFFVWIREFVLILELLFDYEERVKEVGGFDDKSLEEMFENSKRQMEHNIKFLIDLYFNLSRSTLSLGATGFMEILKNRFEITYPVENALGSQQQSRGLIPWKTSR